MHNALSSDRAFFMVVGVHGSDMAVMAHQNQTIYTKHQLIVWLSKDRGKWVHDRTFYRWLEDLCIAAKDFYSLEDYEMLKDLCLHYAGGGKKRNYPLFQEMQS